LTSFVTLTLFPFKIFYRQFQQAYIPGGATGEPQDSHMYILCQ